MSGVPYIGAKISLVSRSEIRYVGILAQVDPKESTIGLENVVMMGTEDRKATHEGIPPNNQIYDFVLFRSLDIKDLRVCEAPSAPSPPPSMGGFVDPAIVQQQERPAAAAGYGYGQQQAVPQYGAWGQQPKLQFGSGVPTFGAQPSQSQGQQPTVGYGAAAHLQFGQMPPAYAQQAAPQSSSMYQDFHQPQQQQPKPQAEAKAAPPKGFHPETASNIVSMTPKADQRESAGKEVKVLAYSTATKKMEQVDSLPQSQPGKPLSYASMAAHGAPQAKRVAPASVGGQRGQPAAASAGRPQPSFSFQHSAAGQQNLSKAQEDVFRAIQDKTFYNKSSFFDDISCEAKSGNEDGRLRNERSWNVETFGMPAPPNPSYQQGGRGGSREGSRGGHRGGSRGGRGGSGAKARS